LHLRWLPFDLGADNIKALKCPVLIIKGDNDGVDLNHIAEMYTLCGGGVFGDITRPSEIAPGNTSWYDTRKPHDETAKLNVYYRSFSEIINSKLHNNEKT
jgi:hypothetical protein